VRPPEVVKLDVVYAVIGVNPGDGATSLPFFSQLNFKIAAERLDTLGFQVSLRLVPLAAA
jgi:uncharacterized protein (TIGR04141 family)